MMVARLFLLILAFSSSSSSSSSPSNTLLLTSSNLTLGATILPSGTVYFSNFSFYGAGAFTINLPLTTNQGEKTGGSTVVFTSSSSPATTGAVVPLCFSSSSCSISSPNATTILISNLTLAEQGTNNGEPFASETWTLSLLNDTAFSWTVVRTYLSTVTLLVNRVGISLATTGGLPIHSQQIPSYLDINMFLDESTTGGFSIGNTAYEYLSPNSFQYVRFSPTGVLTSVQGDGSSTSNNNNNNNNTTTITTTTTTTTTTNHQMFWSFAKPFADGTTWCNIGYEAVDPRESGVIYTSGTSETLVYTMNLLASDAPIVPPTTTTTTTTTAPITDPFPSIDLYIPNATLASQISMLTSVQYMVNGWLFGNNPASVSCLHESAWWPLITSLFPSSSMAHVAMKKELSFFGTCGWQGSNWTGGYSTQHSCNLTEGSLFGLSQRYASSGFYWCPWGPLQDENVMFPIAVYYTAVATGDMQWLLSLKPALDAIFVYMQSRGMSLPTSSSTSTSSSKADPVVFICPASGIADGGKHSSNWYDIILFGHLDAFIAVHAVWAMQLLSEMYTVLGDTSSATLAASIHAQAVVDFNTVFWNETANQYHDWIDIDGNARSYYYTDIAFTAIIAGISSPSQASALLHHYDTRLEEIYVEYNVTRADGGIWAAPASLYPIETDKEFCIPQNNPPSFPSYENGGSFLHSSGLQLSALGVAQRQEDAYNTFLTLMNSGFAHTRGWEQQLYWGPVDTLVGFDPLNTALLALWGFVRSGFGVTATLTKGLYVVNPPATALVGGRWNMSYLGEDVCLQIVKNNNTSSGGTETQFCNGTAI